MTTRPLALVGLLALSTACAGVQPQLTALPDQRLASLGNLGARSSFEIRTLYAAPEAPPPADAPPKPRKRAVTPILFTIGVVGASLLGAGAFSTGVASYGLRRRLDNSYFDGGLSYDEYDRINTNGERLSDATWGLGISAFAFAAMALIAYSVDWQRCGPLAPKRRRVAAPPGRCEEFGGTSGPQQPAK